MKPTRDDAMSLKAAEKQMSQVRKLEQAASKLLLWREDCGARIVDLQFEMLGSDTPESKLRGIEIDLAAGLITDAEAEKAIAPLKAKIVADAHKNESLGRELKKQTEMLADVDARITGLEQEIDSLTGEARQAIDDHLKAELTLACDALYDAVENMRKHYIKAHALDHARYQVSRDSHLLPRTKDRIHGFPIGKQAEAVRVRDYGEIFDGNREDDSIQSEVDSIIGTLSKRFPEILHA